MKDPLSSLPYKQLLFPPYRKETNISIKDIPIYSTITPTVPPFLPYRKMSRFAKSPGIEQQIDILKDSNFKK